MLNMLSARYTTNQNQKDGEFHRPNEMHSTVKLKGDLNIDGSKLSLRLFQNLFASLQASFQNGFKKDFLTKLAHMTSVITMANHKIQQVFVL